MNFYKSFFLQIVICIHNDKYSITLREIMFQVLRFTPVAASHMMAGKKKEVNGNFSVVNGRD
jgi:hypothetical protein